MTTRPDSDLLDIDYVIAKQEQYLSDLKKKRQGGATRAPFIHRIRGQGRTERYPAGLSEDERAALLVQPDEAAMVEPPTPWTPNLIVNSISLVVAGLFKGETTYLPISWVAVGQGMATWDDTSTPLPTAEQAVLVSEIDRVPATVVYLDGSNVPTLTVTNRLQISGAFAEDKANGVWREWGLFAGPATPTDADPLPDPIAPGLLLDYYTQEAYTKTNAESAIKRVRLDL